MMNKINTKLISGIIFLLLVSHLSYADDEKYDDSVEQTNPESVEQRKKDDFDPSVFIKRINELQKEVQVLRGLIETETHQLREMINNTKVEIQNSKPPAVAEKDDTNQPEKVSSPQTFSNDKDAYTNAYQLILTQKFEQAEKAFVSFVDQYKDSDYLPNAHYWLGELWLKGGDFDKALGSFDVIIEKHRNSPKLVDAMYKKACVLVEKNQLLSAKKQLLDVVEKYPDTSIANLAQKKLMSLQDV